MFDRNVLGPNFTLSVNKMGTTTVQERLVALNAVLEQERRQSTEDTRPKSSQAGIVNGRRKSVQFTPRPTIVFDSASKSFGKDAVLRNINITVTENTVYGLFGKSGSGKTTTLSCLLGLKSLDSGSIYVRGFRTGCKGSGVPGKRIGYIPQSNSKQCSLHEDFTLKETLHYFGKFYGMKYAAVEDKRKYFLTLFSLESREGPIRHLSSEQKQLVSFIAALIHQPEILVMDEPTLGMDPLAREIVWQHINELIAESKTTVIIASACPYEINMAHTVGFLRGGKLILESSPSVLLTKYETSSLEYAILRLCQDDNKDKSSQNRWNSIGVAPKDKNGAADYAPSKTMATLLRQSSWHVGKRDFATVVDKLQALVLKNAILAYRNLWLLLLLSILPCITIYLLSMVLTFAPKDLNFGVLSNDSTSSVLNDFKRLAFSGDDCFQLPICQFLRRLEHEGMRLIPFNSETEARDSVINGNVYGYLTILPEVIDDFEEMTNTSNVTSGAQLKVVLDTIDAPITSWLRNIVFSNFQGVLSEDASSTTTILFDSITFGDDPLDSYISLSSVVPGVLTHVISFYIAVISCLFLILEKGNGKFDRIATIGITYCDILLAHFSVLTILLFVQTLLSYFLVFHILHVPHVGSIFLAFSLTIADGISGVALGVLIATIFAKGAFAVLAVLAVTIPTFFISGMITPFEGLPWMLKYIGYIYPGTLAGQGLKNIILRGWSMRHLGVWTAFPSSLAFTTAYLVFVFICRVITV